MKFSREDFNNITKLYIQQEWLLEKEQALYELIKLCPEKESKELVFNLLERFNYLTVPKLNHIYNRMCDYIIEESGFDQDSTQLLSMTWDYEADSGQKVLDNIRMPLFNKGWRNLKTVNIFLKSLKYYNDGRTQILILDEFIGSGKTLLGRLNHLKKNIKTPFEVKFCFIAGIKENIDQLREQGIEIFCALELDKGLSGYFEGEALIRAQNLMLDLELNLAQKINNKDLYDYSFGYGNAEALYTMEGCNGNTPNSVFPIFWWLRDNTDRERNTLLTRYELGFQ